MRKHGWTAALLLIGLTACTAANQGPEYFDRAEQLYLEGRWEEAQEALREFLLSNPNHAGAHFYLGSIYAFEDDFRPAVAEGELQLALKLFIDNDRQSPIERFTAEYFEIRCNIESAKVMMLLIPRLQAEGVPPPATRDLIKRMRTYLERARRIQPDFADVKTLEEFVVGFERWAGMDTQNGIPSAEGDPSSERPRPGN